MADLVRILNVALLIAAVAFGAAAGIVVSTRCFRRYPGFVSGAVLGAPFTVLASLMGGYVVAGRTEELLGTALGVPLGLALGCFIGAFAQHSAAGAAGLAISRIARGLNAER